MNSNKRYVDDIFLLWKGTSRQLTVFQDKVNKLVAGLKFELETEIDEKISFLDVLIVKKNGKLETTVFRKNAYTGKSLDFRSEHPRHILRNLAFNFYMRALKICSTEEFLNSEKHKLEEILLQNNFPMSVIKEAEKNASRAFGSWKKEKEGLEGTKTREVLDL